MDSADRKFYPTPASVRVELAPYCRLAWSRLDRRALHSPAGRRAVRSWKGLEPAFSANDIQLFPNPAQEQLMIRMPQGLSWESMQLTTATGNTVLQVGKQQGNEVLLNIGSLPSGLYVLGIQTTETVLWKKIRKE